MLESGGKAALGDLFDAGLIEATVGFPFGGHNDANEGIPHIRPFNVRPDGEISLEQIKSIPHEAASGKPRLARNDIVFNNTNTKELVGKCAVWEADEEYVFSNHMTRLRVVDSSIVPAYLSFAIFHHWLIGKSEILARAHVAQASIMGERFREIEIIWRKTDEQRQISGLLRLLLRARQSQELQTENTNRLKRAAMRELFTRGLRGEAQKETEIGRVPESWALTPAEHIFKLTSGKTRPDHLSQDPTNEKPFPVLGGNGVMGYSSEWHLDSDKILVIGRVGEYCGAIHFASGKVWITDNALYVKEWLNSSANIGYIAAFLRYFDLNRFKRMAGQPLVTQGMINEHSFPLPSLDEQREIVEILDAIDRKIDLHKRKRAILEELFKTLLHKLMTGEIRVADLDLSALEPAAKAQAAE